MQHIHFIGIGGIGMSSLALIALQQNYIVSGCDSALSYDIKNKLQQAGCLLHKEYCLLQNADIVVYSSAISNEHTELNYAYNKVPLVIHRSVLLNRLISGYKSIAISGSHGKTTTTALIAHILEYAGYQPGFSIGGVAHNFGIHGRAAQKEWFVLEADESDRSLLNLSPSRALITNLDYEHAETYKDLAELQSVFQEFIQRVAGPTIVCTESTAALQIVKDTPFLSYGFQSTATIQAYEVVLHTLSSSAHIINTLTKNYLGILNVPLSGRHNLLNALGALTFCLDIGIAFEQAKGAIGSFKGVGRRFEYKGMLNKAIVYEDYGHHPEEINNTLLVACNLAPVHLIFQPHRYTRTQALWNDFLHVLENAPLKSCIITDIYAASEEPIDQVNAKLMVEHLKKRVSYPVFYLPSTNNYESIYQKIRHLPDIDDIILLQGAGPLYSILQHHKSSFY